MRKANASLCFLLFIPLSGSILFANPAAITPHQDSSNRPVDSAWENEFTGARKFFQEGKYAEAAAIFLALSERAKKGRDKSAEARSLAGRGGCKFALLEYQAALQDFLRARDLLNGTRDRDRLGILALNLSNLYYQMNNLELAAQAAEEGLAVAKELPNWPHRASGLIHLGNLRVHQAKWEEALELFRRGIDEADRTGDLTLAAVGWDWLGRLFLRRSELDQAEHAILYSFRLRSLQRSRNLDLSFQSLGRLKEAQGELRAAEEFFNRAIHLASRMRNVAGVWTMYFDRGRVRFQSGELEAALGDFRQALQLAHRYRVDALPADATRVSVEVTVQRICDSLIETAARLHSSTHRQELMREAFEVAEGNRASSLRQLLAEQTNQQASPEWMEALAQLHAAEVAQLRGNSPSVKRDLERARLRLSEIEARTGSNPALDASHVLERLQSSLDHDTVYLSFHLGGAETLLWAVTRSGLEFHRLPPRSQIQAKIKEFQTAILTGSTSTDALGAELFRILFGGLAPATARKPSWLLGLDLALFELPLPALVTGFSQNRPVYLIENHSLELTPGAKIRRRASRWRIKNDGTFLGIGDPIYNTADPRWTRPAGKATSHVPWWNPLSPPKTTPTTPSPVLLARLIGSRHEVEQCARIWTTKESRQVLLLGAAASKKGVLAGLAERPEVVHFAVHLLHPDPKSGALIALSLGASQQDQFLSKAEIQSRRAGAQLVVISGCSSGSSEALPGAGLMGLTRAWLASGTDFVIATHWPTTDDTGDFFARLYQHLRHAPHSDPARALQSAQRDMLKSGNWRRSSRYWASYFVMGGG